MHDSPYFILANYFLYQEYEDKKMIKFDHMHMFVSDEFLTVNNWARNLHAREQRCRLTNYIWRLYSVSGFNLSSFSPRARCITMEKLRMESAIDVENIMGIRNRASCGIDFYMNALNQKKYQDFRTIHQESPNPFSFPDNTHPRDFHNQKSLDTHYFIDYRTPSQPSNSYLVKDGYASPKRSSKGSKISKRGRKKLEETVGRENLICQHCNTRNTTLWRRLDKKEIVCNPCGLYYRLHKEKRPINYSFRETKRRVRAKRI